MDRERKTPSALPFLLTWVRYDKSAAAPYSASPNIARAAASSADCYRKNPLAELVPAWNTKPDSGFPATPGIIANLLPRFAHCPIFPESLAPADVPSV